MRSTRFLVLTILMLASCGHDAADREYLAALRGEEEGMTRQQQIQLLDRAIAISPKRSYYYETRATYRIDLREFPRAIADLNHAIALQDRPYLQFMRGLVECQSGRPETSLPYFNRAIAGQPGNWQFYRGRSLARTVTGDPRGGLADAETLIVHVPQQAESHHARGMALAALRRYPEAIAAFDVAVEQRPELIYPLVARAAALEQLGDHERARDDRFALTQKQRERQGCAVCADPFRY